MALTTEEKIVITKQRDDLKQLILEQGITGAGINKTLIDLNKAESFNKSQWDKFHINITKYEKETESMTGEHVVDPLSENDIQLLAHSGGRLYQNPNGTNAKKITQFNSGPIASGRAHELDNKIAINDSINLLTVGTGNSGTGSQLVSAYNIGDSVINLQDIVNPGWILVGNATLLKIGGSSAGGSCDLPQFTTEITCTAGGGVWSLSNSYAVLDRINDANYITNDLVTPVWNGFTNSQRLTKSGGAAQGIMDSLVLTLQSDLNRWLTYLKSSYNSALINPADNQDQNDVNTHLAHRDALVNYLSTTPIEDGLTGIGGLQLQIANRESFIPNRVSHIKNAKTKYFGSRYSFTNARADVQSGTLKRILFLSELKIQGGFNPGGTPEQQTQLANLNKLLASA